ncbi:TlpA family protein disulfide reductase [Flavobacterium sp. HSC-61S13]|uniref:TlpA family protein disulfide reductase n=1 Tax=Flavobacterium sp. HSC-61S13 TaxID=2910963 RepID=UPI00209F72C2|nr:TlpA family protein disulfide reductase [Flavobacterium sp. HSC-61S13]MCP1996196.1 thiol-disulfide isomerase/thioredoxin [Flavobacterium sp. HSC-61S13]
MKFIYIGIFTLLIVSCQPSKPTEPTVKMVAYEELEKVFKQQDDILYVVNFWATWCKPCIEELPDFMAVNKKYQDQKNFKMVLVSLDRAKDFETVMKPFLQKNQITTDVYLLDDNKRMNTWIPAFDTNWSGAIPATFLYKNGKKLEFKEQSLSKDDLEQLIKTHL